MPQTPSSQWPHPCSLPWQNVNDALSTLALSLVKENLVPPQSTAAIWLNVIFWSLLCHILHLPPLLIFISLLASTQCHPMASGAHQGFFYGRGRACSPIVRAGSKPRMIPHTPQTLGFYSPSGNRKPRCCPSSVVPPCLLIPLSLWEGTPTPGHEP